MPRPFKPPRIFLDRRRGSWVIRDRDRYIRTGCKEYARADAEKALARYAVANNIALEENRAMQYAYFIYFMTTEKEGFPVKIGVSKSYRERMGQHQTALPYKIKTLAILPTNDPLLERRLQRKFAHIRLEGEWFEQTPELTDYIEQLVATEAAA